MICRMQVHLSNQIPSEQSGCLDPQRLAKTLFDYPSKWELNSEDLAGGKTKAEKEQIRLKASKESYKVATYIARAFSGMQDKSIIYLPYNFE